jgi:hypothetical protein
MERNVYWDPAGAESLARREGEEDECAPGTMLMPSASSFHFIRWIIKEGKLHLVYCPTAVMVVDTLMKALPSPKVKHFAVELGLHAA